MSLESYHCSVFVVVVVYWEQSCLLPWDKVGASTPGQHLTFTVTRSSLPPTECSFHGSITHIWVIYLFSKFQWGWKTLDARLWPAVVTCVSTAPAQGWSFIGAHEILAPCVKCSLPLCEAPRWAERWEDKDDAFSVVSTGQSGRKTQDWCSTVVHTKCWQEFWARAFPCSVPSGRTSREVHRTERFELRVLHLLGRCSPTWTMPPSPFCFSYFSIFLPRPDWTFILLFMPPK
jgi:hypothetical protein